MRLGVFDLGHGLLETGDDGGAGLRRKLTAPAGKSKGLSYGLLGTGAVLVGAGGYFGLQALSSRSAMAELPAGDDYDAEKEALSSNALLADVLIWPGLAVTGAGVYLMLQ